MDGRPSDTAAGGSLDLARSDSSQINLYGLLADAQPVPGSLTKDALIPRPRAEADATYTVKADIGPADRTKPDNTKPNALKADEKDSHPSFLSKIAANTWLQINGASYHFDRGRGFNERNFGLGVMYKFSDDKAVAVGQYKNSIYKTSHYAYFDYEPLKMGPVRAGALAGVVDGYYFNNGGFIPMVAPTASIEGKHLGVSAFYIPPMKNVSSVVGFQARFKFW